MKNKYLIKHKVNNAIKSIKRTIFIHSHHIPFRMTICKDCKRAFTKSSSLSRHRKYSCKAKPSQCDYFLCSKCLRRFNRKDCLTRHLKLCDKNYIITTPLKLVNILPTTTAVKPSFSSQDTLSPDQDIVENQTNKTATKLKEQVNLCACGETTKKRQSLESIYKTNNKYNKKNLKNILLICKKLLELK